MVPVVPYSVAIALETVYTHDFNLECVYLVEKISDYGSWVMDFMESL